MRAVAAAAGVQAPVLYVMARGPLAQTSGGRVIVVHGALARLPQQHRRLVLAHELAHIELGHWVEVHALYRRLGADTSPSSPAASAQAHRHEMTADAYAARVMARLGMTQEEMAQALLTLAHVLGADVDEDTPTHPAVRKRVTALRAMRLDQRQ